MAVVVLQRMKQRESAEAVVYDGADAKQRSL